MPKNPANSLKWKMAFNSPEGMALAQERTDALRAAADQLVADLKSASTPLEVEVAHLRRENARLRIGAKLTDGIRAIVRGFDNQLQAEEN